MKKYFVYFLAVVGCALQCATIFGCISLFAFDSRHQRGSTGLSVEGTLYNPNHFAAQLPDDAPIVFYIGAMASGHLTREENPEV